MIRNIKMPKRVWLPALLVVVAVAVIGGGVALAANIISNVWQSPVITVNDPVTPPTPPPSNGQLVISSTDFTSNRTIGTDNASRFTISLSNPSETGAPGYTGVRVLFEVNKSGTIADGDVTLKYSDGTNWYDLPVTLVDGKRYQMALLLQPTPLSALRELGEHGEVMPQKSTFFYPKLATGLIINPLG